MINGKVVSKKKSAGKVKEEKTSRVREAIKILNASIEDSVAEETSNAKQRTRRKKASSPKGCARR